MKPADRKKQLIAEGRLYRAELMIAKETVRAGLQPEALARNALTRLAVLAITAFRQRNGALPAGLNVPALLPLVISGVSALARKKPWWKGALIAGAVAGTVALIAKTKQAAPERQQDG